MLNRLLQKDYINQKDLGSGDVRFRYNDQWLGHNGRTIFMADSEGSTTFTYDAKGRHIKSMEYRFDARFHYVKYYDALGRIARFQYPNYHREYIV